MSIIHLSDRAIIRLSGDEVKPFLQHLVSNDVMAVRAGNAVFAALLTPQGKFAFDFIMVVEGEDILLDTESAHAEALMKRLTMYKLRSKVTITPEPSLQSYVSLDNNAPTGVISYPDPRDARMGTRFIAPTAAATDMLMTFETHRIALGIPEGSKDATDRTILLENGYDKLHGVSFTKGCYVGQEVTARSHHRGELRKYIYKVQADEVLPPFGTAIMAGESNIGEMRSSAGNLGLALIRTDRLEKAALPASAGGIAVTLIPPFWLTN
jgi:folate-binding protein YgfZ